MGKGEYGEPVRRIGNELHADGSCRKSTEEMLDRYVACINALDGKKDPEEYMRRVRALVEAVDVATKSIHVSERKLALIAALASLRKAEGEET